MKNQLIKNNIFSEDFQSFETESLSVDFITINIQKITDNKKTRLASYFQEFGFNSYQKKRDRSKSKQEINDQNRSDNPFEVYFILKVAYQPEIQQLQFPGLSGKQFYKLIKQKLIQWQKFPNPVLSRVDLVYKRIPKNNDPISTTDFINSSYIEFQDLHTSKNLASERNQKGLILKIGNRRSQRYYRIYTTKNSDILRFEAEMKGDLIKDFQDLLITSSFEEYEFESKLAYQFFKYSFEIFSPLNQTSHTDWLANRIRPYQSRNLFFSESVLHSDYLNQMDYKLLAEQKHLITLLRLLNYVQRLDYQTKSLKSQYRQYKFPLIDFLKYNKATLNHYQTKKLKTFFDLVKQNFVIESFSHKHYRMLVTIPEVVVSKTKNNILMVEIWIAEDLFDYLHPFLFSDIFQQKLTKHQFQVLFEIIKNYTSINIRKEFNIVQFLDNYPSALSNQQKIKIREYFIDYFKLLHQDGKLKNKVLDLSSNKLLDITDLNPYHKHIAVFENINVTFADDSLR